MNATQSKLAHRIEEVEKRVNFIMGIATAQIAVGSPLDPRGPQAQTVTFAELYQLVEQTQGQLVRGRPIGEQSADSLGATTPQVGAAEPPVIDGEVVE